MGSKKEGDREALLFSIYFIFSLLVYLGTKLPGGSVSERRNEIKLDRFLGT
jgi:hypothetical protein